MSVDAGGADGGGKLHGRQAVGEEARELRGGTECGFLELLWKSVNGMEFAVCALKKRMFIKMDLDFN
jgi:hypothetical protein